MREQISRQDADAAVFLRVTDVSRQDAAYAPIAYRTFWGYYRYWTPIVWQPGYVERDTDVRKGLLG